MSSDPGSPDTGLRDAFRTAMTACERASDAAHDCADDLGAPGDTPHGVASSQSDCVVVCADTALVLGVLADLLARPYEPRRAVSLRRMLEAGLAAAVECAAECDAIGDDRQTCERCSARCRSCIDALREALRELTHVGIEATSGAT